MDAQQHKIGLAVAVVIGVNAMIGAGIFNTPNQLMLSVGPAGILTVILVSVGIWFMASAFARLAELYPQEGSFFTYAAAWGGKATGTAATMLYLVGMTIAMGLLSRTAGMYLQSMLGVSSPLHLGTLCLIVTALLTLLGVRTSKVGQYVMIACTLFPIAALTLLCLAAARGSNLLPFMPHGALSIAQASRIVVFNFFGFECAASLFKIMQNPQKNVGKAFVYSIGIVAAIYIAFVAAVIAAFGPHIALQEVPLTQPLLAYYPNMTPLIALINISITSAILGTVHAMLWSASYLFSFITSQFNLEHVLLKPQTNALVLGLLILIPLYAITAIGSFFYLTASCVVTAYLLCIIGLLRAQYRNTAAVIAAGVGFTILTFAVQGLLQCL